ncbi:MAG: DMT family transporter [Muribaculaceae bacterium]|nr:DMT family transporter [Muribaculaceae bacterium]
MIEREKVRAHLAALVMVVMFGLMAPLGKDAMNQGITGLQMATMRIAGGALLFWLVTPLVPRERVPRGDLLRILAASVLGVVGAQGGFIVGVSMTSPINAGVELTSQPIFALIFATIILHERLTWRRAAGVLLGFVGAAILVSLTTGGAAHDADYRGDLMVLGSQVSFALYLTLFTDLMKRYSLFTFNRWMFTFGALIMLALMLPEMLQLDADALTMRSMSEVAYIVVCCTFLCFVLVTYALRHLPSTVVSSYNYVEPVVTVVASLAMGIAVLQWQHLLAAALIFMGVWLVVSERAKKNQHIKQQNV